jgi:NAD(P)-dependent dehydrogenase (short-subunit alcohol dehydrogenase family)
LKTAVVTGAARGIGRAAAEALVKSGFRVVGIDREFPDTAGFEKQVYDLYDVAGIPALIAKIGKLDVLVNNAGVQPALAVDRYTDEARSRVLRINLEAPVELIRAASKGMIERRSGRIVNLASVAAYTPHTDLWYGISKAGVVSFTRSFASYLGPHGIQVNAVAPGPIDTDLLKNAQPERVEQLMRVVYTRRKGRPEEVAEAIRWLATDAPQILNGAVIDVTDGCFLR